MKLHSDILTMTDIAVATRAHGMTGVYADTEFAGSRSREFAFVVHLTGTSSRRPNGGTRGADHSDDYAATWDEWGMFLAALYRVDPQMLAGGSAGRPTYASAEAFHAATGDRFETLTAPYQHGAGGHQWEAVGDGTQACKSCSATINNAHIWNKIPRTT